MANWRTQAECARPGTDPEWWFPPEGNRVPPAQATRACRNCPVRRECLAEAIEIVRSGRMLSGWWAGIGPQQITRLAHGHRTGPAAIRKAAA